MTYFKTKLAELEKQIEENSKHSTKLPLIIVDKAKIQQLKEDKEAHDKDIKENYISKEEVRKAIEKNKTLEYIDGKGYVWVLDAEQFLKELGIAGEKDG